MFNAKDAKGKFFVRELIENGKNVDGGFTDYYWQRANSDEPIVFEARDALINQMELHQRRETSRIRQVLDQASSPLLLANGDGLITYANKPAHEMFTFLKPILMQHCPGYRDGELATLTLDQLHPDPVRFLNELKSMSQSMQEELRLGDRDLNMVTTRVVDDSGDGEDQGFVAEWLDVTEKLAHDREMDDRTRREREKNETIRQRVDRVLQAVDAASSGDLRGNIIVSGDDAVGLMSSSLDGFLERLRDNLSVIGTHVTSISNATGSLFSTAEELGENAKSTSSQAATASASATNISDAVDTVASVATQMNSSIQEIADNTNTAATVAQTAVELAAAVDEQMRTTREITQSVQAAAAGCGDVVNNVSLTAASAEDARTAAAQSCEAVEHLTNLAKELDGLVTYYKVT